MNKNQDEATEYTLHNQDGENKKRSLTQEQLVYRICSVGRWITGSIVIIFIARLIWQQNRALNFIASHSGDSLFIADIEPPTIYVILFIVSVVLTIALSVARHIVKSLLIKSQEFFEILSKKL